VLKKQQNKQLSPGLAAGVDCGLGIAVAGVADYGIGAVDIGFGVMILAFGFDAIEGHAANGG